MYNYTKAMAQDIREYIADEIELGGGMMTGRSSRTSSMSGSG